MDRTFSTQRGHEKWKQNLDGKHEGKRPRARPRSTLEDNIKMGSTNVTLDIFRCMQYI
jgi:hypothetical protein